MLKKFRENNNSIVVKVFLWVLALSFVTWGINDYIVQGQTGNVIEVGDVEISAQEFSRDLNLRKREIESRTGQIASAELLKAAGVTQQLISNLVRDSLLLSAARDLELRVSPEMLREMIRNNPAFEDQLGEFNFNRYKQLVSNMGMTTEGYEKEVADNLLQGSLEGVFSGSFEFTPILRTLVEYERANIDISYVAVTPDDITLNNEISEERLQEYFEQNQNQYNTPETRTVEVMYLPTREKRRARHILVDSEKEAQKIYELITSGKTTFEDMAQEESLDEESAKKGGDLGVISPGEMVGAFENVAFVLAENELSRPVESPFGWHLIEVTDIERNYTEDEYYELNINVEDRLAGGEGIEAIADALDLKYESYKKVTQDNNDLPPALSTDAFVMEEGEVSTAIDLDDGRRAYVRVRDVMPSQPMTFAEAKDLVKEHVELIEKFVAAQQVAKTLKEAAAQQKSLTKGLQAVNLSKDIKEAPHVNRIMENAPAFLTQQNVKELFKTEVGDVYSKVIVHNRNMYVVEVDALHKVEVGPKYLAAAKDSFNEQISRDLQFQFINELLRHTDVDYNIPLLKAVAGETFTVDTLPGYTG